MLGRSANGIYWMARYIERAENLARLLDDALDLVLDASEFGGADLPSPLDGLLSVLSVRDDFERRFPGSDRETLLRYLTFDRGNTQSVLTMITAMVIGCGLTSLSGSANSTARFLSRNS